MADWMEEYYRIREHHPRTKVGRLNAHMEWCMTPNSRRSPSPEAQKVIRQLRAQGSNRQRGGGRGFRFGFWGPFAWMRWRG